MKRNWIVFASLVLSAVVLSAQQSSQQDPYQGTSRPPADDTIQTTSDNPAPPAKPAAGRPIAAAPDQSAQPAVDASQSPADSSAGLGPNTVPIPSQSTAQPVMPQPSEPPQPVLETRAYASDPDGDIVHPDSNLPPGAVGEGTTIRVKLLDRLSTATTEKGEPFRSQVASDVFVNNQVLIPSGAEIDGTIVEVSSGHVGGSGSIRLRPETVILADGTRFSLHAEVSGTPGSNTHVVGEGTIKPDPRIKRDSIEYGGAVGAGAITGAVMGGPVGALTGGLIGAGVVTAHLMVSHSQATLEPGTTLLFTLTEPLNMTPAPPNGN